MITLQTENFYLFWSAIGVYAICDLMLICQRHLSRQAPINYVILLLATLCQGWILSFTTHTYTPQSVFMVFIVATSAFLGMTLYGLCARKDVGVRLSILSGAVAGGVALGFVLTQFSESEIIYLAISCLFVFISLVFVCIDTQMMLKERHFGITPQDYIVGTLLLWVDFVNLFNAVYKAYKWKKRGKK